MLSGDEIDIRLAAAIDSQDIDAVKRYMGLREKNVDAFEAYNLPIRKGEFVGQLPLYIAIISTNEDGDTEKKFLIIDWLIAKKANPDFKNSTKAQESSHLNNTPLLGAAFWGEFEVARYLIEKKYIKNLYRDNLLAKLIYVVACHAEVASAERKKMLTYLMRKFEIDPFCSVSVDESTEENPLLIEIACDVSEQEQFTDYVDVLTQCGFQLDFEQQTAFQGPEWNIDQSPIEYSLPLLSQVLSRGKAVIAQYLLEELNLDPAKLNNHGRKLTPVDVFACRVGAYDCRKNDSAELETIYEIARLLLGSPAFLNKKTENSSRESKSLLRFILEDLILPEDHTYSVSKCRLLQTIFNKIHPQLKWTYQAEEDSEQDTICLFSNVRSSAQALKDLVAVKEVDPHNQDAYSIGNASRGVSVITISDVTQFDWEEIEKLLLRKSRLSNSSHMNTPAAASLTFLANRNSDEKKAHDPQVCETRLTL
jgi:hypothetical protein